MTTPDPDQQDPVTFGIPRNDRRNDPASTYVLCMKKRCLCWQVRQEGGGRRYPPDGPSGNAIPTSRCHRPAGTRQGQAAKREVLIGVPSPRIVPCWPSFRSNALGLLEVPLVDLTFKTPRCSGNIPAAVGCIDEAVLLAETGFLEYRHRFARSYTCLKLGRAGRLP